jgi:hypothetical protein
MALILAALLGGAREERRENPERYVAIKHSRNCEGHMGASVHEPTGGS